MSRMRIRSKSSRRYLFSSILLFLVILAACNAEAPPNTSGLQAASPVPTLDATNAIVLCAAVNAYWGQDWLTAIRALEMLEDLSESCGSDFDLVERFYAAYVGYGAVLEASGHNTEAIAAYQRGLNYHLEGAEAIAALTRLGIVLPDPLPVCDNTTIEAAVAALPEYVPVPGEFVQIEGNGFTLGEESYSVYGVNYYPRDYPYHRFLTEMEIVWADTELSLLREAGLNTLRIFLRHDDLFQCPGSGVVPRVENLIRLDVFIQFAASQGYKVILVLNQDADLTDYPLYGAPEHTMAEMAFIARRYRDEPTIMAYDLRDWGDEDYLGSSAMFSREAVLGWLSEAVQVVREGAPNQLVTAGWDDDSVATIPLVDFVSFQHFGVVDSLRQEIAILTDSTDNPILLTAVGYSTYEMDELGQRQSLQQAFEAVERNGLSGWVVWTAFDYPLSVVCVEPNCPGQDGPEVHFGLWNTSYFPKRALDVVRLATGATAETDR